MDEREIARLAMRRGLLTEPQLAQAEAYAAGGRSLVSVLLDLGHLRAQDLLTLRAEAAPRRGRAWPFLAGAALATVLCLLGGLFAGRSHPPPDRLVGPTISAPAGFEHMLSSRAFALLRRAEQAAGRDRLPPGWEPELTRAAALLEQALLENGDDPDLRYALGRCRELLDQWEAAAALYAAVLHVHPDHGRALLGAARVALLLREPRRALEHAERAVRASPGAESFYVHGQALLGMGDLRRARDSFRQAVERDRSFQPAVAGALRGWESAR